MSHGTHTSTGKTTVLFVAAPAPLGGSNQGLATLLEALEDRIHRVVLAPPGAFTELIRSDALAEEVIHLPRRGRFTLMGRALQSLWALLVVFPRRSHLLAIHANATSGLRIAALAGLVCRVPVVCWVHDMATSPRRQRWGSLVAILARSVVWAAVSDTAREVAINSRLCRHDQVTIVRNPINPARVQSPPGVKGGERRSICFLGRASSRKGFDLVPAVIERIQDTGDRWLLFTNRHPDPWADPIWAQLDRLPAGQVTVLGFEKDVRKVYSQCDIVFVPSRQESFGRVVAEAMMNSLPVVATHIPSFVEQVGTNEAGLLFPIGDASAAAAAIDRLLGDENLRKDMGEEGKRRSRAYSPVAVADQMFQLYSQSNRGRPSRVRLC